MTEI
jgi:chromosome segregation ATPase